MCDAPMQEFDPHTDTRHLARAEEVRSNPHRMKAVKKYVDQVNKGFERLKPEGREGRPKGRHHPERKRRRR